MPQNEDETRDRLFHPFMKKKGFPSAASSGPERYDQQGFLETGFFDGCYMYQGKPLVLVELKAEGKLSDSSNKLREDLLKKLLDEQLLPYAYAEDFDSPPPYLLVSDGIQFIMYEATTRNPKNPDYKKIGKVLSWKEVQKQKPGEYSTKMIELTKLIQVISPFIDEFQDSIYRQLQRIERSESTDLDGNRYPEGIFDHYKDLKNRIGKSLDTKSISRVHKEIAATSALNYLNKIIFLKFIEDNDLDSYFRVLREFDITKSMSEREKAFAGISAAFLKKKLEIYDSEINEEVFREFVRELKEKAIDTKTWYEITQAAFSLAEVDFPKVYSKSDYDYFYPENEIVTNLIINLKKYDFSAISEYRVGELYQTFLRKCQQQQHLGAFYTPKSTVRYMVENVGIKSDYEIIDPACGSGHFLESCVEYLKNLLYDDKGYTEEEAISKSLSQVWGNDIDPFAVQLSAIRLFFKYSNMADMKIPNVFVFDSLGMVPVDKSETSGHLAKSPDITDFSEEMESGLNQHHVTKTIGDFKVAEFDVFIGNPPYGGKPTKIRRDAYKKMYRKEAQSYKYKLGSNDAYGFFLANAIRRVKNGGKICFILSDTFLSIISHEMLRRLILDTCC
ncbi:MAG: N-6 DNA methylase, partial [Candidatus Lokiarchaeota archaeon]|nr:N-6 DNA methylase [Candidatus Lokiarchaeota archaeon]